jgi:hypothetical protein
MTKQDIVLANQYLYYVLGKTIWEDRDYDDYCRRHGIEHKGGSDCDSHYSEEIKKLARYMLTHQNEFSPYE